MLDKGLVKKSDHILPKSYESYESLTNRTNRLRIVRIAWTLGFKRNTFVTKTVSQMKKTECLTLETLPQAFTHLTNEVSEIKRMVLEMSNYQPIDTNHWFNLQELCNYLPDKPSKACCYGWVHACTIPVHKSGKKLRFLKSDIDLWLKQGRKQTLAEAASENSKETDTYLSTLKKKKNICPLSQKAGKQKTNAEIIK